MNATVPAIRRMLVIGLIAAGWFSASAAAPAAGEGPKPPRSRSAPAASC